MSSATWSAPAIVSIAAAHGTCAFLDTLSRSESKQGCPSSAWGSGGPTATLRSWPWGKSIAPSLDGMAVMALLPCRHGRERDALHAGVQRRTHPQARQSDVLTRLCCLPPLITDGARADSFAFRLRCLAAWCCNDRRE